MSRRAKAIVPKEILDAARAAGAGTPLWYAGRSNGHHKKLASPTVTELVKEARERRGIDKPPPLPDLSKPVKDRHPER